MTLEKGYDGKEGGKWRMDNALPFNHREAYYISHATKTYDLVCALDTNSEIIRGDRLHIGSAFRLVNKPGGEFSTMIEEFVERNSE